MNDNTIASNEQETKLIVVQNYIKQSLLNLPALRKFACGLGQ
jgi:hypothetical protein